MPNVGDLKTSKFLTKNDVQPDKLVTISGYKQMNVAMESDSPEEKYVLTFREFEKPLVLNMTNGQLIAAIVGSEDFDDWIGKRIVLYNDKNVSFGGRLTGGIRVRAPRTKPANNVPEPDETGLPVWDPENLPKGKPEDNGEEDGVPF